MKQRRTRRKDTPMTPKPEAAQELPEEGVSSDAEEQGRLPDTPRVREVFQILLEAARQQVRRNKERQLGTLGKEEEKGHERTA